MNVFKRARAEQKSPLKINLSEPGVWSARRVALLTESKSTACFCSGCFPLGSRVWEAQRCADGAIRAGKLGEKKKTISPSLKSSKL